MIIFITAVFSSPVLQLHT